MLLLYYYTYGIISIMRTERFPSSKSNKLQLAVRREMSRGDSRSIAEEKRHRKLAETRGAYWQFEATHDPLTKMLNRRGVIDKLTAQMTDTLNKKGIALLFVDIDHFKEVNDELGHDVGDNVLIEYGNALSNEFNRSGDNVYYHNRTKELGKELGKSALRQEKVGRFGGDEFIIIGELDLDEDGSSERSRSSSVGVGLARMILHANEVSADFVASLPEEIRALGVDCSIGGNIWLPPGSREPIASQISNLFSGADQEMYKIKQSKGVER